MISVGGYSEKQFAIALCSLINQDILKPEAEHTFATLNTTSKVYWLAPQKKFLEKEWWFVLKNTEAKRFHIFCVLPHSISSKELTSFHETQLNVQILWRDCEWKDKLTGFKFKPFLAKSVSFEEILDFLQKRQESKNT
ncbi:MAG: hypothetical protein MJZ25_12615 [Fibrobacter sp.]|nr:hypothetical protein [Fibrobacter sp.]